MGCPPLGPFWGILARICASFGENNGRTPNDLSRHARPGVEPVTSCLPVLRAKPLSYWWGLCIKGENFFESLNSSYLKGQNYYFFNCSRIWCFVIFHPYRAYIIPQSQQKMFENNMQMHVLLCVYLSIYLYVYVCVCMFLHLCIIVRIAFVRKAITKS